VATCSATTSASILDRLRAASVATST
jgi:hypothetical protein